jgi:hypothetical protein
MNFEKDEKKEIIKEEASNEERRLAREIIGGDNYMRYQVVLMKDWLDCYKKDGKPAAEEDWIDDRWSEAYVRSIIFFYSTLNNPKPASLEDLKRDIKIDDLFEQLDFAHKDKYKKQA